jgi:Protein of unknown function (DUF1640)
MTTVAFDTLSVAKRLQKAGFTAQQAEAMTAIVSEASDVETRQLVTKKDLQIELAPLRTDLALLKWMAGVNSAMILGVLLKLFLN